MCQRLSGSAAEAIPRGEQDGDGDERCCPGRWIVGMVPVVNGVAQACEREEDAEDGGERPVVPRRPRVVDCPEAGACRRRDSPGVKYLFAIEHGSLQNNATASSVNLRS